MGEVYELARSNDFIIKDLPKFKEGLKGFTGDGGMVDYNYFDYKKRSKNAEINISSSRFDRYVENKLGEEIDVFTYIQQHIKPEQECVLHVVSLEHASDMAITVYKINSNKIDENEILI